MVHHQGHNPETETHQPARYHPRGGHRLGENAPDEITDLPRPFMAFNSGHRALLLAAYIHCPGIPIAEFIHPEPLDNSRRCNRSDEGSDLQSCRLVKAAKDTVMFVLFFHFHVGPC